LKCGLNKLINGGNMHEKGRDISDNHIKGTSKHAMRVHGMLGKETNLNPACIYYNWA
jgi:hypothetical protein